MSAHASKRERPPINPAMLRWARKRSGKTIDDAAKKAGSTPERVSAWEIKDSDARPTVRQARRLADLYGRQFVEFFRANPPDILEPKLVPDFRMYRGADDRKDVIGLKEIQGWAEAKRINALDLFDELGEQPPKLSKTIFTTIKHDEEHSASMARKTINFAISEQLNLKASERYKLPNILRGKLESAGMLVLKRADIKSLHARGICIAIFPLPVIVFGNEAPAAQAFTLAHEFAHVLLKRSGIIGGFARAPEAPNWAIERWCNAFAASFLMPADQLIQMIGAPPKRPEAEISDEQLSAIANLFGVSAHAMLIRLTHVGFVDQAFYWDVKKPELDRIDNEYKSFGRPSYYGSRYKAAVGDMYTSLVIDAWAAGRITNHNAAEYMGIKNLSHLYDIRDNFLAL